MSSLPGSKPSLLHATRSCSALALAGAIVLPVSPAIAHAAADAPAAAVAGQPDHHVILLTISIPTWATTH